MSVLRRCRRALPAVALAVILSASLALAPGSGVGADVVHHQGFEGRVDGDPGWFGSFSLAGIGPTWCIDSGLVAPDADLAYQPTELPGMAAETKAALAWLVGSGGEGADAVGAAGIALAAHHIVGAHYPSGPLDVHLLTPAGMEGFGASAAAVVASAREAVDDALAHRHLRSPYRLALSAHPVAPGAPGVATATLTDGRGEVVAGVELRFRLAVATAAGPTTVITDARGQAVLAFRAGAGDNVIEAVATAPDLALTAYAPTRAPAQRVIRPGRVEVRARATFPAAPPPPGTVRVRKVGDAEAWVPLTGARFEVVAVRADGRRGPVVAQLVTDDRGTTPAATLPPGRYLVRETSPPPGYQAAGPWPVTLSPGQRAVVRAPNAAVRGRASIVKVDADTGRPLAGARLTLAYDADGDGTFETALPPIRTTGAPTVRDDLLPGRYRLVEVQAPSGFVALDHPVDFELAPGGSARVRVDNRARPTPPSTTPPSTTAPPTTAPTTTMPTTTMPPTTGGAPPTTAPPTTAPPTTVGPVATPSTVVTPPRPALARTGAPLGGLLALGVGLCLLGAAVTGASRRRAGGVEAGRGPR